MPDWLLWAAFGVNLGSALAWWYAIRRSATRERKRLDRWQRRGEEQVERWLLVDRCPVCTARLQAANARLAARGLEDTDGPL